MVSDIDWNFAIRRIEELEKKVKELQKQCGLPELPEDWNESLDSKQDAEE